MGCGDDSHGDADPKSPWAGFRAVDRAVVLAHASDLLDVVGASLTAAEALGLICEIVSRHLSLVHAVLVERMAGQSRAVVWSARDAGTPGRMLARERAWTAAAAALDGEDPLVEESPCRLRVAMRDARLGLFAMLYVESNRELDGEDERLLGDLLRRMLEEGNDSQRKSAGE